MMQSPSCMGSSRFSSILAFLRMPLNGVSLIEVHNAWSDRCRPVHPSSDGKIIRLPNLLINWRAVLPTLAYRDALILFPPP